MKSLNFEILRDRWPELATLGGFAEKYSYPDPSSSLIKLRSFIENMVQEIYRLLRLDKPYQPNLYDLVSDQSFKDALPNVVLDKLHAMRIHGNKAAHGEQATTETALWLLKEAYDLARWFFVTFGGGKTENCPYYQAPAWPEAEGESKAEIKRQKKVALEKLAAQEAQLQELLATIEAERAKAYAAEKKVFELKTIVEKGRAASDDLKFDEETTRRRLIDSLLVAAGWNVAPNGQNTDEVTQEQEVEHQPTETGKGFADYVLWDENDRPLAVIEAKKTAKNSADGKTQAKLYADGLEKMHQQRPVIFYTNGFDIWIWDDQQQYPPRSIFGFYSKDSLQYLVNFQRKSKQPLKTTSITSEIIDRPYQREAVRRITERFEDKRRKALIVQATGTGKTRVAIALAVLLIRAGWVKRILFLCDRRELRKQAKGAFSDFTNEPLAIVRKDTAKDRHKRIYLATYPAMMKIYQTFDVGFFDLIIADESHRSIYNRYRDLFRYFDSLQVGLTATPVDFIARNTFRLFECEERNPTAYYPLEEAVGEKYLVPYEVYTHTTQFLRIGIKYEELTVEQRQQLEDDGEIPELFDYEVNHVDKQIYNKETNREIIRNLMENGIRESTGQHPGKTIIFARNHRHALLLQELFDEMYPQYGGKFCQVIDNYDPRAEQLIDDFKGQGSNDDLTIAISVDMLDTGIDIHEIVNLVFAKPVRSKVKFWQMIGRGTRKCENLFGPGKNKTIFRIFDHWGNFEYFDQPRPEAEPKQAKPLMQMLFEIRIDLADIALNSGELEDFKLAVNLIGKNVSSLPEETIAVREKWREKRLLSDDQKLQQWAPTTVLALRNDIAPLMQWINIRTHVDAYELDLLIAKMQIEQLKHSGRFEDYKDELLDRLSLLQMHLNPVREKVVTIKKLRDPNFWSEVTVAGLEEVRKDLRAIMRYSDKSGQTTLVPKIIDIPDGEVQYAARPANIPEIDMTAYVKRVEEALLAIFDSNPTLKKIREGKPVTKADLEALTSLVLTQHPGVDLKILEEFYSGTARPLDFIIRSIIGMEAEVVKDRFATFVNKHSELTSKQIHFMRLLQNHISKHGSIEVERLYEAPFTTIHSEGLDGVFPSESQVTELISIIKSFGLQQYGEGTIQ